ncbi:MAG: DUF3800 domain-containing protein [Candidatus Zixiibacteriota bacterium]
MSTTKYRMYVDETGTHDLRRFTSDNERYLSLTGVIIDLEHVRTVIHPQLERLKCHAFGQHPDEPIILHRTEISRAKPPFQSLKDKNVRDGFDSRLLRLLSDWQYRVITICLDKMNHVSTYATWRYHPYHYCLAILLERYVFFLQEMRSTGDVLAESRGGKEDKKLKESFSRLWRQGTDYVDRERIQNVLTSKQLKVKPKSNNIAGLQLADILAQPSRNEILREQGLLSNPPTPFALSITGILQTKYYQKEGKITGCGKKFI